MFFEGKSLQKHLGNIYTDPKVSFVEESLHYLNLQKDKNENISLYELDAFSFMMLDQDEMEKKIHSTPNDKKGKAGEPTITAGMIQSALHAEKEREEAERKVWFVENFDSLTLLDIYASEWIGEIRRNVIRDLLQVQAPEKVIKSIIRPEIEEGQVLQKRAMWMEMEGVVIASKKGENPL